MSEVTLRDFFAANATEEDIKAHAVYVDGMVSFGGRGASVAMIPGKVIDRLASKYAYADAMLEARKQ